MYDLHFASETEGSTDLSQALLNIGFRHDNLLERGLTFNAETGQHYNSCPLIALHMTAGPFADRRTYEAELTLMEQAIERHGRDVVGYWHAEIDAYTRHLRGREDSTAEFPVEPFQATPGGMKEWDIHLSVWKRELSEEQRQLLLSSGFYYITRWELDDDGNRVEWYSFTIQGTSAPKLGREVYDAICEWWEKDSNLPRVKAKFEVTIAQKLLGEPTLVPPTISSVSWRY